MENKCETVETQNTKRIVFIITFKEEYENVDLFITPMYFVMLKANLLGGVYECAHVLKVDEKTFLCQLNFDNAKKFRIYLQTFLAELTNVNIPLLGVDNNGAPLKIERVNFKIVGGNDAHKLYTVEDQLMSKKEMGKNISDALKINFTKNHELDKEKFSYSSALEIGEAITAFVAKSDVDKSWTTVTFDDFKKKLEDATKYYPTQAEIDAKTSKVQI